MRCLPLLLAFSFLLAACGVGTGSSGPPITGGAITTPVMPDVRALVPADIEGDGVPDAVPHPSLRRLLVQAPAGTRFRLTRGTVDVPFSITMLSLSDGATLFELALEAPIGSQPMTLRAGNYALGINADEQLGVQLGLLARPTTTGALANDFANPTGALYASADDVAFCLSGGLPSLVTGSLVLRSGLGKAVELLLSAGPEGLRARAAANLEPRRVYSLQAAGITTDPYGRAPATDFHLVCRGKADGNPIKLKLCDLNRDGEAEVVCLFNDGAITTLTNPLGKAEGILPRGDETALDFATGDFDGNGAPDILMLVHGKQGYRLLTMYNQTRIGHAQFVMQPDSVLLDAPVALRAADFDRDGRDDYAVLDAFGDVLVQYSSRPAQILPGLATRSLAVSLLAEDATGDGKPDLYVMGANGRGRLFSNLDGRGFSAEVGVLELGSSGAQRVFPGDLDGDKNTDFVFTGRDTTFSVVLGQQLKAWPYRLEGETERVAGAALCRDVNSDSRGDIILVREDDRGVGDEVAFYLNRDEADGSPDAILPMGVRVRIECIEYWREHVVFASSGGLLALKVNTAELPPTVDSKVRFVEAYQPVPQIPAPLAAAMADFNDDGKADLAALDRDGNLQVWLSGEEGQPFTMAGEPLPLGMGGALQAIDFDRDSAPDLLYIPNDPAEKPRVLRNGRDGRFADDDQGLLPTPPSTLRGAPALGDFDRDGDLDVLWPSPLGRVQFNEDRDGWRDSRADLDIRYDNMPLQFSGELCCADFTGDGIADVVAVMQLGEDAAGTQYLVLLEGTGSASEDVGPFRAAISTAIRGRMFGLSPADFNGDGKLDLGLGFGATDAESRLTLLRLNGLQFESFEGSPAPKGRVLDLALDDLDRDGDLDLIVSEDIADVGIQLTLWVNDGRGQFGEAIEPQRSLSDAMGGFRATNLSLSDFTGDGRPDLMAIDRDGNVVIVRTTLP